MRRSLSRRPPLACGLALIRRVPFGASSASSGLELARLRRRAPPGGSSSSTARGPRCARACPCRPSAPDGCASSPRTSCRRSPAGRSSPWACGGRSSARRGAPWKPLRCAPPSRSAWISATAASIAAAICLVHALGVAALDEVRLVAVALEELPQLVLRDAGEEARVGDLVAVQVEDRQHAAVAGRVEELVAVPARGQRAGLGLAVADDAGDDQVGVVERGAEGVARGRSPARRPRGCEPGVSGATWLGMPPGKLNCLNSFFIPSSSWLMFG